MQLKIIPLLELQGVRAFSTERGLAENSHLGPYDVFNICHYTGDVEAHTARCRSLLARRLGVREEDVIVPRQTHSSNVRRVTGLEGETFDDTDGLVTTERGKVIGVNTADCVPIVMADSHARVIAVAHAGWRGAIAGIASRTLEAMVSAGADAGRVHVAFGPSICASCFEVGPEVASEFPPYCVELKPEWERPHVNLQKFITVELSGHGVSEDNIISFSSTLCTRCHPDRFFSARRLGVSSGRVFTFAYLD
ncbi:MAG: peptidoglycan editing factor PgeF [Muribaculaceae bacterium]|nr:peptidoglycan editing factor PgeF [Muribaculaceae bacterium]